MCCLGYIYNKFISLSSFLSFLLSLFISSLFTHAVALSSLLHTQLETARPSFLYCIRAAHYKHNNTYHSMHTRHAPPKHVHTPYSAPKESCLQHTRHARNAHPAHTDTCRGTSHVVCDEKRNALCMMILFIS
jgi:hypothetical protein